MPGGIRWKSRYSILTILFFVNIVSFMDRSVMAVAIPFIAIDFRLSPLAMGVVMSAFFASYSIAQIPGGLLADRFGARRVATIAMLWWSAFTAVTGAVGNLSQMLIARFAFGLGEGVYPACAYKTIATWFPKSERATATGMLLACSSVGTALAPLMVIPIVALWGWRAVFYTLFIPGILGALLFWTFIKDSGGDHERPEAWGHRQDVGTRLSDVKKLQPKSGWRQFVRKPDSLKLFCCMFLSSLTYWGFTAWLPTYLVKARGFSMAEMGIAASLPAFAGVAGCIIGGWSSERLFSRNRAMPLVGSQLLAAFTLYLTWMATSTTALLVAQTITGFSMLFFISTFWSVPMNTVAKEDMGVASGIINFGAQLAAFVSPIFIGFLVQRTGNFDATFGFMIAALLSSCAISATLSGKNPADASQV